MLYYVHLQQLGTPKTGLSLTWEYLLTAQNGTDKSGTAPSITEVGGGWYKWDIKFGAAPWDVTTEDLLGVIDGSATLAQSDRYIPISITKRGLGLIMMSHKGTQTRATGDVVYKATDDSTDEVKADMTDNGTTIIRALSAP